MSVCPFAKYKGPLPSGAYASNSDTSKIGLVFHVIVGSEDSADSEFHNGAVHLSAHFGIADGTDGDDNDGDLIQWLDTDLISYAQGAGNWPPAAYLSCETAGQPDQPMTNAQLVTAARLAAWCAQDKGFPLIGVDHGGTGITTHAHYPSGDPDPDWGNHSCPGMPRINQIAQIIALASNSSGGFSDVPAPTDVTRRIPCPNPDGKTSGELVLHADGSVNFNGLTPGFLPQYVIVGNDNTRYAFGPGRNLVNGQPVIAYPGLPANLRQGSRYFVDIYIG